MLTALSQVKVFTCNREDDTRPQRSIADVREDHLQVPKADVMLTTHEVVTSEALGETLAGIQWDVMLLDQVPPPSGIIPSILPINLQP